MRSGRVGLTADSGKTALISVHPRDRRKMTALLREAQRAVQQAGRLIDFPERPEDQS